MKGYPKIFLVAVSFIEKFYEVKTNFIGFSVKIMSKTCLIERRQSFPSAPTVFVGLFDFSFIVIFVISRFRFSLIGAYGGHIIVVDSVELATLRPQTESFQLKTQGLLFSL